MEPSILLALGRHHGIKMEGFALPTKKAQRANWNSQDGNARRAPMKC